MPVLLSILVPTKNRYESLFPMVRCLSQMFCDEVEIIIQDNSENNEEYKERISSLKAVKYFYTKEWLSVGDNFDKAILNSTGEYVISIGDDDAVVPEIVNVARLMKKYDIDSCRCRCTKYRWPTALIEGKPSFEYYSCKKAFQMPNVEKMLMKMLENGAHTLVENPCVYHGIIKRSLLDKVYEKTGSYFPGPSPDIANSAALQLVVKTHIITEMPFVVDGYSKASTGHMGEKKQHIGKLEEQSFLPKETVEKWSKELPRIWLPNTIWPESVIQSLKRCGREDLVKYMNFDAIYIKMLMIYPQSKKMCIEMIKANSHFFHFVLSFFKVAVTYVINRCKKDKVAMSIVQSIEIDEAIAKTSEIINKGQMFENLEHYLADSMN